MLRPSRWLRAAGPGLLLLLAAAGCAQAASSSTGEIIGSRWRQSPPAPPAAGSELFRRKTEGRDPLLWEDDDLARIRDLHARGFDDKKAYLEARDLADYLGLAPVEQMHMTQPLHVVFVGFQGDGNMRVRLDEATLTQWFAHLDHLLPHTRISLAELTCAQDGHCSGPAEGSFLPPPPSPLPSHVRLNFSINVVAVERAEVLESYERAVAAFSRPVDPDFESGAQQVDALKLEAFIDSFVEGLGLDSGYSIIVVNPKWSSNLQAYGFRAGFSLDELELLQEQVPEMRQLSLSHWEGEPQPPRGHAWGPTFLSTWSHRSHKVAVSHAQSESMAWVRAAQTYLAAEEDHRRRLLKAIGPRTKGALAVARAVGMLRDRGRSEVAALLGATITLPPEHFHNPKWRASHPLEDCLVPAWTGHGRWLLLDLTAQKSDWGPAMGGEGVVTTSTLPDVTALFSDVADARESAREDRADAAGAGGDGAEEALREELADRVAKGLSRTATDPHEVARLRMEASKAGPRAADDDEGLEDTEKEQVSLLRAELDIYEQFALQHCHRVINPPVACADAREAAQEIRHELQSLLTHSVSGGSSHFRDHHWDIFGLEDAEDKHQEVMDATSRVREHFLGSLSDVLSRAIRHAIAPPSAAWRHPGLGHGSASPYAEKVHFTLHLVSDTSRKLGEYRARGAAFDADAYKLQVQRLALPHQTFTFSLSPTNLLDDPPLAAAFAVSMRTGLAEVPDSVTAPTDSEVVFIDSRELAHHLRRRSEGAGTGRRGGARGGPHVALEVPVFIFSLDRDAPVLIDAHYNARALEDMVLVVDNAANQDEHPTGFLCDGGLTARPLSPMRHALAATLQHLGGVLPPHLGYNPSRHAVSTDWLWSVGAHPLSWTSTGTAYSQLHIDALHRSYLLDALDAGAEAVNAGIALLARERPSAASFARARAAALPLRQALQTYAQVVGFWRTAVAHAAALEFGAAADLIPQMHAMADAFYSLCEEISDHLHPKRCAEAAPISSGLLRAMLAGSGAAVVITLALTCGLPRKKSKKG